MLPRIQLLLCVIFWGWGFVATKVALPYLTPVEVIGLRFLIGLPILYAVIRAKKISLHFPPRQLRALMLGSVIITIHFLIQITGMKYTSATNTGWIISVTPLVLAVLSYLILKERLGRPEMIGIIVATFGIFVLVSGGRPGNVDWLSSTGDWLVLGSAHTWALYTIATRDVSRSGNPLAVTFSVLAPSGALVLLYMLFTSSWSSFLHLPLEATLAMLFLGVLGLAVAHWFWQEGVAEIGAARSGLYLYLEPLATTGLAVPYLGEAFGWATAVGGGLVLFGVFWAQGRILHKKANRPA